MATRLQEAYQGKIRPSLKKEFGYTSDMQVPRLEKIVVNMGVGDAWPEEAGRKVRTPQGRVVGNAHRSRGQGKCHRK